MSADRGPDRLGGTGPAAYRQRKEWGTVDEEVMVCVSCGSMPSADAGGAARVEWARGIENGRPVWTCPECSRRNLRSMEGKLVSQWW